MVVLESGRLLSTRAVVLSVCLHVLVPACAADNLVLNASSTSYQAVDPSESWASNAAGHVWPSVYR